MGNIFPKFINRKKPQILLIGLNAVGRSTILNQLKLGKVENFSIGIGFQQQKLLNNSFEIISWDIEGSHRMRLFWKYFYEESQGLILVLDITDKEGIVEVKEWLEKFLIDNKLNKLPLLIYANKIDLVQINLNELVSQLQFEKYSNNWHIQPCCAITREGLEDGIRWILQYSKIYQVLLLDILNVLKYIKNLLYIK